MKRFSSISSTRSALHNAHTASSRRSGFTVIEVLVALAILLIGGLAIMNLFPPALNVVRGSENREVAMSQVKGTLAKFNADPASIPDAIYDKESGDWTDPVFLGQPIAVEGNRNRNNSLPNEVATYDDSALGRFKHIIGERHKVLINNDTPTQKFVLLNHAYIGNPSVGVMSSIEGVRIEKLVPIAPSVLERQLDFSNAVKASNGSSFTPAPTTPPSRYYVSYKWISPSGAIHGVVDEPILPTPLPTPVPPLPASDNSQKLSFPNSTAIIGPVEVKVLTPEPFVTAPNPTPTPAPTPTVDQSIRGYLPLTDAVSVSAGDEIVVDYDVRDWRWIVEDTGANTVNIAGGSLRDVKLTIPDLGANAPSGTLPTGISPLYALVMNAPNSNYEVQPVMGGLWNGTKGADPLVDDVNRTAVVINKDYIDPTNPTFVRTAPRVRLSYWASQGWTQQLSVAASSYYAFDRSRLPASVLGGVGEPWREFYWQPLSQTTGTPPLQSSKLYFHASEAGKTVMVSFMPAGSTTPVMNQIVTIGSRIISAPTALNDMNFFVPGVPGFVAEATLVDNDGSELNAVAILSVRGVSVQARSAWLQNGNYTQEVAEMYRPLN